MTNATFGNDRKDLDQIALIQIHDGDDAQLFVFVGKMFGVSSVHFCLICSVNYTVFRKSLALVGGWAAGVVSLC